jgi:aryl-alcohol dehydrogenase-like predicted oxidoreductase
VGETFAGVDFEAGLETVESLRPLVPLGATMAQFALRWILMFDAVSCAIPSAKNHQQALQNVEAADLSPLSDAIMTKIRAIYDKRIRDLVHQRW